MNAASTYNPDTGQVIKVIECSGEIVPAMLEGLPFVEQKLSFEDHYVVDGVALERPTMPCQVAGKTISGIPQGAKVFMNQSVYVVDDGIVELSCDQAISMTVVVTKFPYKPFHAEINFAD